MPEIDDNPIPRSRRKVVEFNAKNRLKNLRMIVDNEERSPSRMIKSSTKAEIGQWCLKHKKYEIK